MDIDRTVSKKLYNYIIEKHPALRERGDYRRLFTYLALGPYMRDEDTGAILVPAPMLAGFQGKAGAYLSGNYNAKRFLEDYKRDVAPSFSYSRHSKRAGKCRAVIDRGINDVLESLLNHEDSERRYFVSGKVFNPTNQILYASQYKAEVQANTYLYKDQRLIAEYLNSKPLSLYKKQVEEHYIEALLETKGREERRDLEFIRDMPQPFYRTIGNNPRLFSLLPCSLVTIRKEIRRALCKGWIELDLSNCQAAIIAGVWKIERLHSLLQSGRSLWEYLYSELAIPPHLQEDVKPVLKKAVYALINGIDEAVIEWLLSKEIGKRRDELLKQGREYDSPALTQRGRELANLERDRRFTECPMIADILEARAQAQARIIENRGCYGAYGWVLFDGETEELRTFVSRVLQSYELSLIASCFEVASARKDFAIMLYQFDGFSIDTDSPEIREALDRAVRLRGEELGIRARLH